MKTVTRISQRGTVAGSLRKDFRARSREIFPFFPFFFSSKKKGAEQMYKRSREHKFRPLHSMRSVAPSELKNKRILGSAPYIFTYVSFILHESSVLVLPLIGL